MNFDFTAVLASGGPTALLAAVLAWLIRAVATGTLVAGTTADRLLETQQDCIDRQAKEIEVLLGVLGLPLRLIESLPVVPPNPEEGG